MATAEPAVTPPEPETDDRLSLALVVVGVVLLASLATFVLLLLLRPPKQQVLVAPAPSTTVRATVPGTTTTPSSSPTTVPPGSQTLLAQAQLDRDLPDLRAFVEQHRHLRFKAVTRVVLDASPVYLRAWHVYLDRDAPLLAHLDVVLTAFGLNPSNVDLVKAQRTWLGDDTVAFYDPATEVLHVRAAPYTPYVKQMLVGMLTRSLDDQWFAIDRLDPARNLGDQQFGLSALVSGDQKRIANTWLSSRPFAEQQDAQAEAAARLPTVSDPALVPVALARWISTPETAGPDLVAAVLSAGGQAALDKAFAAPPSGSREAMMPAFFVAGQHELAVPSPAPGGTVVAKGRFGQFLVQEALTDHVDSDVLSQAMDGYLGDTTVAWRSHGQSCVRIRLASADLSAAGEMEHAVSQWADAVRASYVVVPDPTRPGVPLVEATVCHAGGGSTQTPDTDPSGGRPNF